MVTHECTIPYSTCRGETTGLFAIALQVWCLTLTRGQVPVVVSHITGQYLDIALTTVQYGIYCPGGSFDLRHIYDSAV